jgi:aspartyl-tRNA(Asn)/glutamyl-tRNA(Gln) amidotransferase subunit A
MTHDPQPWRLGAAELLQRYRDRALTPRQALESCLGRIEEVQPRLNAFVALRREAALAEADASGERWRAGAPVGTLDGVPLAVKDNLPTADLPTTWGCAALADHRPARDELAVARARAAGAIVVGKTNVPEFTLEGYTHNRLFGTTGNPWNPALTPGGSSGGSVAAVAAGCVPFALGTDGGGSIRRPASHTGLVGLKPSIGAVAREHALPPLLLDFEVVGPMARTVDDARRLFEAVRGPSPGDRRSKAGASPAQPPGQLRVLYVPTLDDAPVDAEIAASCERFAARLAARGHRVTTGALPLDLSAIVPRWPVIGQIGLAWLFERQPGWKAGAAAKYVEMAALGAAQAAPALWDLLESVEQLRRDCVPMFDRFDLVVTPAAAALPWPAAETHPPTIAGRPVGPRGHAVFTGWVNAAGLPALALPCEPSRDGLPIGVQLVADHGRDDALLTLGEALQGAWQWPPL